MGGDPFLMGGENVQCHEPFTQRYFCILEDCSRFYIEILSGVLALVFVPRTFVNNRVFIKRRNHVTIPS